MRPIRPALAFYLRHPHEIDNLWDALSDETQRAELARGVADDDWRKLQEVVDLASKQVGDWLVAAHARALQDLGKVIQPRPPGRFDKESWWVEAHVQPRRPSNLLGQLALYVGLSCGISSVADDNVVYIHAYLATPHSSPGSGEFAEKLLERVQAKGLLDARVDDDANQVVLLNRLVVTERTDLDKLLDDSTSCFRELATHWKAVFA